MNTIKFARLISYITHANRVIPDEYQIQDIQNMIIDMEQPSNHYANPDLVNTLLDEMNNVHGIIPAIKTYRALTGAGLKEAKEAVERYRK